MMWSSAERATRQNWVLGQMAQVLTKDEHSSLQAFFESLSDEDFYKLALEMFRRNGSQPATLKQCLNINGNAIRSGNMKAKESGMCNIPVSLLSDEDNAALITKINASRPSDTIQLSGAADSKIINLWESNVKENEDVTIPSDLFFAETIPLMDCNIIVDERDENPDAEVANYRVVIFSDYAEQLRVATDNDAVNVGAIEIKSNNAALLIPISVVRGVDSLLISNIGFRNWSEYAKKEYCKKVTLGNISQLSISLLETWYGIQIALLHPVVREVFRHSRTVPVNDAKKPKYGKCRNKVKYIKQHIISTGELDIAIYGDSRGYTRRSFIWYVIGHWRVYADGKKVFVKPYWKGALRDVRMTIEEREREIAQVCGTTAIIEKEVVSHA